MRPVHCVVIAYGEDGQLDRCLAAIAGSSPVTVVDNGGTAAASADRHGVDYIRPGGNLGFAGGVNVALRRILAGDPCDVLLLNPDAVVAEDEVATLAERLQEPHVAAVAPVLVGEDGGAQRVAWPFPTPARAWLEAAGLGALRPRASFLVGAVLLLRWEALLEVGLFDERFFLYAEEADWQRRAVARGWRSLLCVEAVARHRGAGTSSDPRRREHLFHAAQETYIRKWYGRRGWLAYRAAVCVGAVARALVLRGARREEAARRAALYARGPRHVAAMGGR